jgi:hypothetical protein
VISAIPTNADFAGKAMGFRDVLRFSHQDQLATTIACVPTIANSTTESVCTKPGHRLVPFAQLILSVRARVVTGFPILKAGERAPNQELSVKFVIRMPIAEEACFATLQVGHHPDLAFRLQMEPVALRVLRMAIALPESAQRGLVPTRMPTALRVVLELLAAVDRMAFTALATPGTRVTGALKALASVARVLRTPFADAGAMLETAQLGMYARLFLARRTRAFTMEVRQVETRARQTLIVHPVYARTGSDLSSADSVGLRQESLVDTTLVWVPVSTPIALVRQVMVPSLRKIVATARLHTVFPHQKHTNQERLPWESVQPRQPHLEFDAAHNTAALHLMLART